MKQLYILITILLSSISFAQNFTDTKGELQISSSGTATYTLPIAVPPSIKGVAPTINLTYSSGVRGGIAGQGWSINSISSISRIATRRDIDGSVDGVDFDNNDKLALDGQRLLLKTGTYWTSGSTYETEYNSNTKIELKIEGSITFFIVTGPDGSRTWYGSKGSGTYQNAASINAWYIVRFEDPNGNAIEYNYSTVVYNNSNQLYIDTIKFSGNPTAGIAYQNQIKFNYDDAKRVERDFIKGVPVYASKILSYIEVKANNTLFRKYSLDNKEEDSFGYQRVKSIQESNAQGELSNPVEFAYNKITSTKVRTEKAYTNNLNFAETQLAGDFDGDGRVDFVANNQLFTNLFKENSGNAPIALPFTNARNLFSATTLTNNKLNQFQSIIDVQVINKTQIAFNVYNYVGGAMQKEYTKTIPLDLTKIAHPTITNSGSTLAIKCLEALKYSSFCPDPSASYKEGDFDGNGISEVLILKSSNECQASIQSFYRDASYVFNPQDCPVSVENLNVDSFYLVDLDPNQSTALGSSGYVSISSSDLLGNSAVHVKYLADFNGDGKTDILQITRDGRYKILEIIKADHYGYTNLLGFGTIQNYSYSKQILIGDYNGDGKTDIMLPTSEGGSGQTEWNIYYANPNPAGGSFFVKETLPIVEYWPDTGGYYETQRHWSSYYAMDINGDGKSDVVRVWRKYYSPDWTINDHNTQWWITAFTNNIGKTAGSGFTLTYNSDNENVVSIFGPQHFDSNSPDIPIPITSNYRYHGANTDLVLVRGHYNKIEYYQFNKNKDVEAENRLTSVTESNGNIKQTIDYKPMEASNGMLGNSSTDFYSSGNTVNYPNIEIIRNSQSYLVSKLTATINGVSKYQDFKYRGYVSNYNYGTVGFSRTSRSSWYLKDADPKIWTTQYNDVNLRGATTKTWTSTNGTTVFDTTPTGLISTKTNFFDVYTKGGNNVYNVLLTKQTVEDHITNIKNETVFTYDGTVNSSSYYGLEIKNVSKQYSGATLQGTTTVDTQYESNPTGTGNTYYIGRPKQINTSKYNVASSDTRTSEEIYTYTGSNLTKTEKKGHNTYALVEDMTYDTVGNLLTKTISAPGATPAPTARTIADEYDASKRFVVKKTDHQLLETKFVYNSLGQVTQSTDPMGVVSGFTYDNWGKLTNTTVSNSSLTPISTTLTYTKLSTGGYTVTSTNSLDAKTITEYDVLGRVIKTSTKGFAANTMVTKQVVYDGLGRKEKESEPYFSTANLWTTYEYDYLMRPTKVTAPTGKIQTLTYSGLTTASNDDGKTTTATVDALGNKVQTTDPGGTINFTYFAGGQLKESNYQGNKVTIDIDGWGNKVKMTDPSAGVYTYSYDAFGQLKTETTPNGTTSFVYDPAGRQTEKTIVGTNTNSKTTYAYNSVNQITSSSFTDNNEAKTTTNNYEYDTLKRLFKTTETTPYAVFVKQLSFDSVGRVSKETSTATASGKTSTKTVKNTYQNGFPWQIVDDATQQVLWQTNSLNERGQLLTAALGNGTAITNTYDQYGYNIQIKHDRTTPSTSNLMTLTTNFESKRGNLNSRTNSLFGRNETFKYDALDRLTEYTNGLGLQETQVYDEKGRITQNSVGSYEYDATKTYQNKTITPIAEATGYYANREGIFNDSMEDKTGWGNERYPATNFFSYDKQKAGHALGANTLKLANTTTTEQYVFADEWVDISNTTATEYTYSAWVYSDSPQSQVFLYMKDGAGIITTDNVVNNTVGSWTQIVKTFSVPANVKKIRLRLDNNGLGNIWYDDVQIRKTSDAPTTVRALNITYNTFKGPVLIEETGVDKISFTYNDGNDRSSMFYGGLQNDKLQRTYAKHYSADGTMEIKRNMKTGALEFVTYIGGDGYSAPVVLKSDGTTQNYLYLHRDYQGTIVAISDQSGAVVEKRLFDAWGNIVKVQDGAGNILAGLTILDRGYTGHEHLQSIGIIHMNGRLYDPKLHRFLQPDNFIQQPENTQNYNKYGYCLNNPLKYTDPTGEVIPFIAAVAIGAAISALTYTLTALLADVPFSLGGLAKATFIGAASAAVTFGIGSACGTITNSFIKAGVQALAHGTFQGTVTAISGGKFWSGFAAGALSSVAASAFSWDGNGTAKGLGWGSSVRESSAGMIAFGTVSGGAGAALTGGNFWQGAATGLVVSGLNHAMHKIQERTLLEKAIRKGGYGAILDDDPYLNWSNEEIREFALKVFPDLYESAECPSFEKQLYLKDDADGKALFERSGVEGKYTVRSLGKILIKNSVLNSIRQLGSVVGHELNHMTDYVNGSYANWINKYGLIKGRAYSEVKAYEWQKSMGASIHEESYNNYLNLTQQN